MNPRFPHWLFTVLVTCLGVHTLAGANNGPLLPTALRCESSINPLGVDIAKPKLSWQVESDARGARQTAYQLLVASSPTRLAQDQGDLWDSGRVRSSETVYIPYDGAPLRSSQPAFWKVRVWDQDQQVSPWSDEATWTMGLLAEGDWCGVWIVAPWESESLLLRKEFRVKAGLQRAVVHVCGLGHFEMSVNGEKPSHDLLAPGWTKYNRTCLYETYDITDRLQEGENVVGLMLGDGMYHVERRNRFSKFQGTFGPLRAIVHIRLVYQDGSVDHVGSDDTWKVNTGPVTYNDVYGGEDYDARRLPAGWQQPGFDDADWANAVVLVRPAGRLRGISVAAPPIAAIEVITPVATRTHRPDMGVIDLGQNASYMPRITVRGPRGSTVRFTHAEVTHDDGTINRSTCGGNRGPAWWQYTKSTDELETWFPQFFYAGCRYLQVDKFPASPGGELPQVEQLEGIVVHSSATPIGQFACSNELLNRTRTLIRWAQRSNMMSVLTDCPHREKLGWLEQYHLNGPSIRYEFDVARIFRKGMQDMADSQLASGLVPNIAPEYVEFPGTFRAAAEWGSAVILVPWQQYQFNADTALLRAHYGTMQKYMDYLATKATNHIIVEGLGDWYDLGPADRPGAAQLTPPEVTATAFYFYDARTMSQIAKLLGHEEDAAAYLQLSSEIRDAWIARFRHADNGTYATNSQCANALALVMHLAEPQDRDRTLDALVKDVRERGNAMTAGDVGFRYLLLALAEGGRSDVIYDMIDQDEQPGYGYQLKRGATSLTEAWDANDNASHNHFMLGHIMEWFYKYLAGIETDPTGPGFKKILIRPTLVGDLAWVQASYDSIRGEITSEWNRTDTDLTLRIRIPANTTATVFLPTSTADAVTESGRSLKTNKHVRLITAAPDRIVCEVDSGAYEFRAP